YSLYLGQEVTLSLPNGSGGLIGKIRCEISDTIGTGVLEIDRLAAVTCLPLAQRLTGRDGRRDEHGPRVDGYRVRAADGFSPEEARAALAADPIMAQANRALGLRSALWHEIRGNVVELIAVNLNNLRLVMICLQALCVFTVAAVFSTLVAEKRHDIGVLIGLGTRPHQITAVFLITACAACVTGGLIGWAVGWGGLALINPISEWLDMPLFPQEVFYTSSAPISFDISTPLLFIAIQAGIGLLAATVPAWRAGRTQPVDTIRERG
ncbi:MAG: ABC transporter permease, partial [Planctomycetota bacterium]